MSDSQSSDSRSFEQDVLRELGDDKLQEIAGLLGTDATGAQEVVGTTVSALSGDLQDKAAATDPAEAEEVRQAIAEAADAPAPGADSASGDAPLQGVAAFGGLGGLAAGGMMSGVLAKMSKPVANAVSKKTGIPAPTVSRVIEMLIPVVLAVLTKRAASTKGSGGAAPKASAASGGLGDLLGQILGGKK
ncbi:DUF937 domain-containing protein [Streptomyces sp. NPDC087300]|uniref:DUF937 domain-containing protein n=1 Tax=Streptomyces sp. NPDC087300 TaxID=3365780 RepID=UPI00380566BB